MKIKFTTMNKAAASKYNFNKGNYFMICPEYKHLSNSQDFCEYINKDLSESMRESIDTRIVELSRNKYLMIEAE